MSAYRVTEHKRRWIVLALITIVIACLLSPWASPHPDGLERVAEDHGFLDKGTAVNELAVIPDYEVAGIPWSVVSIGLAGGIGIVIMVGVLFGVTRSLTRSGGDRIERRTNGLEGIDRT
ncbi:cobalt/nickel transport protein [Paenibacillus cellulosilyticus]|uniref:Cobalt/nickel transport protein n=1 Tax=Paenibacillus cellulosilyticus TaxID=375489 RepID=A0A2V2YNL4_9BACL|nr:PDGLE domain-containing protein [Paenibacillus cellulosilyticus]PWV95986.1 cobalt/nickel transport protein [Paenibacillus cellulosilyticus]QKS48449.1 PDGLE domain-containing protein [Paenibacillus cellulosilyticus]